MCGVLEGRSTAKLAGLHELTSGIFSEISSRTFSFSSICMTDEGCGVGVGDDGGSGESRKDLEGDKDDC